ncbi:MAG: hypothetical protein LIO56_06590 [Lachnospiraceae bacterium]|nr:hypothetical protein [Lachnospiraceae bacterium]
MISQLETQTRQLLCGNLLLIGCCAFYLIWWFIAFKPEGAIKGMRSGWLLIPAFILGIIAIILLVVGSNTEHLDHILFPRLGVFLVGVAVYVILLIVSYLLLKRPVTTELLLIVGWAVLAYLEISALYGLDILTRPGAVAYLVITAAAAAIGIVCYLLYYGLDALAGYIDGTIPLLLVAAMMAALSVKIAI